MSALVVERFQALTARLADDAERRCLALLAAHEAGKISAEDLLIWVATEVNRANVEATGYADAAVSSQMEVLTGAPTPPTGVPPIDDAGRLVEAVGTILASGQAGTAMQIGRLARAEPFATAQRVTVEVMQHHHEVAGWVRQMDGDPCELCRWWSRGGRVWPKDHPFQRHPGCNCAARVVLA